MMNQWSKLQIGDALEYIRSKTDQPVDIGLVLGSGLGVLAERMERTAVIPYGDIPNFPISTVVGHAGELIIGKAAGRSVVLMNGRFHLYEGYDVQSVVFPVRVMRALGAKTLVVTNAAGGINMQFEPGNLMLIEDHINLTGQNPLIGPNDEQIGPRFPDMSEAYSRRLRELAGQAADEQGISLVRGVYAGLLGPSYETPAEIRMLRAMGADAVGMSTVNEVIAARHAGMEVLGISCISNMAAGILPEPLSHREVVETAERVKEQFLSLVLAILPKL